MEVRVANGLKSLCRTAHDPTFVGSNSRVARLLIMGLSAPRAWKFHHKSLRPPSLRTPHIKRPCQLKYCWKWHKKKINYKYVFMTTDIREACSVLYTCVLCHGANLNWQVYPQGFESIKWSEMKSSDRTHQQRQQLMKTHYLLPAEEHSR